MAIVFSEEDLPLYRLITAFDAGRRLSDEYYRRRNGIDYQEYMKDYVPDPDKIHRGPEARQNGEKQQSITIAVLFTEKKVIMIAPLKP